MKKLDILYFKTQQKGLREKKVEVEHTPVFRTPALAKRVVPRMAFPPMDSPGETCALREVLGALRGGYRGALVLWFDSHIHILNICGYICP